MKKIKLLVSLCGLSLVVFPQQQMATKIDQVISVYSQFNKFNGSVLVARKGKIILEKGYGYRNVKFQLPNDPNTRFRIGSITKEFTAAIILKLIEQNKLNLTDKLATFFPRFPNADSISIKNLLTHTSGIYNYTDINDFWDLSARPVTEQAVIDTLLTKEPLFSPDEKYGYSYSNYMLLAYISQKILHKPFEQIMREWIFQPAGMTSSGFDFEGVKSDDKATGYWHLNALKIQEGPPSDSTQFTGSGEMYSTVKDLYKWHQALQSGNIISKGLLTEAYQPYKGNYGYGWETDTSFGKNTVGHGGRVFGFECKMIRIPEDDVFIILLNNCSDQPLLHTIGKDITAILYQNPYVAPDPTVKISQERLGHYVGKYGEGSEGYFEMRLIDGHLIGIEQPGDKMMLELFPLSTTSFKFIEGENEQGIFNVMMDANNKPIAITSVNPRGVKLILKKMK